YTGQEIERILVQRVKEHLNIIILEDTFALQLITKGRSCHGAITIHKNHILPILADQTILATGGLGQVYQHTTNPSIATGDGLAMAIQAGVTTKDLEFIQFHPTALSNKAKPLFLISETLRGEGAKLLNHKHQRFMPHYHKMAELAPRSIVAQAIYTESQNGPIYLDIRHKSEKYLRTRFPQIYQQLKKLKINPAKELIPITPAAHYSCGGIKVDLQGRTSIKNLFAFGEVACTGVHGANRLASNSLLEALVFSNQIAENLKKSTPSKTPLLPKIKLILKTSPQTRQVLRLKDQIQKIMWQHGGILRDIKQIKNTAIPQIIDIQTKLNQISATNTHIAETKNLATCALAILQSASNRTKSLGCHLLKS
ncbi:MAG: FAD-binding protein, partial [Bdellovibrionales bacterium]|nr:FAD-binding protein [Bdellovibrionales bacterium]